MSYTLVDWKAQTQPRWKGLERLKEFYELPGSHSIYRFCAKEKLYGLREEIGPGQLAMLELLYQLESEGIYQPSWKLPGASYPGRILQLYKLVQRGLLRETYNGGVSGKARVFRLTPAGRELVERVNSPEIDRLFELASPPRGP